jgi:chemosensory pili system protein ChpA (sensor histidine kinase/response regulator)
MSVLASGAVVQIYNPVALANVYGDEVRARTEEAERAAGQGGSEALLASAGPASVPLVLVVDDSITVRRVTQRLLQREGYRVALAATARWRASWAPTTTWASPIRTRNCWA